MTKSEQSYFRALLICISVCFTACAYQTAKTADANGTSTPKATSAPVTTAANNAIDPVNNAAKTPDETASRVVEKFYSFYLDGFPQPEENKAKFARFLTAAFLKRAIKESDADLFLDAQDFDETWKNNFTVSEATIKGRQATVHVTLKGDTFKWKLQVTLQNENGAWKISAVKNLG